VEQTADEAAVNGVFSSDAVNGTDGTTASATAARNASRNAARRARQRRRH
jgi:hypothetical protein